MAVSRRIYKDSDGTKMYPVCGFQKSQHKLYYWQNKAWLKVHDSESPSEEDYEELDFWTSVLNYAHCVHEGLIYMPWKYSNRVKEAIVMYDLLH